jgi:hypothetical protein
VTVDSPNADTGTTSDAIDTIINANDKSLRMSAHLYGRDPFLFPELDADFCSMKEPPPGMIAGIPLLSDLIPKVIKLTIGNINLTGVY